MVRKLLSLLVSLVMVFSIAEPIGSAIAMTVDDNIVISTETAEELGVGTVQEDGSVVIGSDDLNTLLGSQQETPPKPEILPMQDVILPSDEQPELKPECNRNCGQPDEAVSSHADDCAVKAFWRNVWDKNTASALAAMWDSIPSGAQSFLLDNYSWMNQAKRAELVKLLEEKEQQPDPAPTDPAPTDPAPTDPEPDQPDTPDVPDDDSVNDGPLYELEQTVGDTTVQASGHYMEGVSMSVTEVPEAQWNPEVDKFTGGKEIDFAFDITMSDADGEWQPEKDHVGITLDADDYGWEDGQVIGIVHEHEGEVSYIATAVVTAGKLTFYTWGFSDFYGFTVDFHYNGSTFSIPGMTSVYLHDVFTELYIDLDASQAVNVEFSDPSLVEVTKDSTGWLLTSLVAFDTEESLTVTFADGSTFVMRVTDELANESATFSGSTTIESDFTVDGYKRWNISADGIRIILKDVVSIGDGSGETAVLLIDSASYNVTIQRRTAAYGDGDLFRVRTDGLLIINCGESSFVTLDGRADYEYGTTADDNDAIKTALIDNDATDSGKIVTNVNASTYVATKSLIDCYGSLWLKRCIFQNHDVTTENRGGGITLHTDGSGEVYIQACMFRRLRSSLGSAILVSGWEGEDGKIQDIAIERGVTTSGYSEANDGYGIHIQDCAFYRNMTFDLDTSHGGTIRSTGKAKTNALIENTQMYYNWSHGHGGAIYWNAGASDVANLDIKNCRIYSNRAGKSGGGIYAETELRLLDGGEWSVSVGGYAGDVNTGTIIENNKAGILGGTNYGGGIGIQTYSGGVPTFLGEGFDIVLSSSTVIRNNTLEGTGYGGGLGANLRDSTDADAAGALFKIRITGAEVYDNTAMNGGGIAFRDVAISSNYGMRTFTMSGGNVYNNTATYQGGGIYIYRNGTVDAMNPITFSGGSIRNNTATGTETETETETQLYAGGGGIFLHCDGTNATLMLSGTEIGRSEYPNTAGNSSNIGYGGGVFVCASNAAQVTLDVSGGSVNYNKTLSGGSGGGIYIFGADGTTDVNISDGTVKSNTAANDGGGVCVDVIDNATANLTISGGFIESNQADNSGGGVTILNNSTAAVNTTVSGGTINNNTATALGGGFYICEVNTGDTVVTLLGGTIHNNTAAHGGGLALWDGDVFMDKEGGTTGIRIYQNSATATVTDENGNIIGYSGVGGGICAMEGTITIDEGLIYENTATYLGGGVGVSTLGVYASPNGVTIDLSGGAIFQNTAQYGGGVGSWGSALATDVTGKTTINAEGTTIGTYDTYTGNTAVSGGGICLIGGELNMKGGSVVGNRAYGDTLSSGGGILAMYSIDAYSKLYTAVLNLDGGSVINNTAAAYGGGIATQDPTNLLVTVNINGGTVGQSGASNAAQYGGGIAVAGGNVTIDAGSVSYNYAAKVNDAGQYLDSDGAVTTTDTNFVYGDGGGVMIYSGNLIVNDGTVSYNKARHGGGIYVYETDSETSATVLGGDIIQNYAFGIGGGIAVQDTDEVDGESEILTMKGGNVIGNEARHGGGIALWGGNVTLDIAEGTGTSVQITGNTAFGTSYGYPVGVGGGICVMEGKITLNGGVISGNSAAYLGGGVGTSTMAAEYASPNGVTVTLNGGAISQNIATCGGGLGSWGSSVADSVTGKTVINFAGTTVGTYGTYTGNSALSGGGVCLIGGELNMNGGAVTGNIAYSNGVVGYGDGGGILIMYGSNSAGIPTYSAVMNMLGGVINNNTADVSGGGIAIKSVDGTTATVAIAGGAIHENTAANGGGVYIQGNDSSLTMKGGYLVGNKAVGTTSDVTTAIDPTIATAGVGGGVFVYSGSFEMVATGDTNLHSNLADFAADDVYSSENGTVKLPAVGTMALTYPENYGGEKTPMNVTDWFEDYATADTAYSSGLNGGGFADGSSDIMRYRDTTSVTNDSRVVNKQLTISDTYVALTLGYKYFDITLNKSGTSELDPDQTYIFHIKGAEEATAVIDLTVVLCGDDNITIKALPPGAYIITEKSGWSWRYELSSVTGGGNVKIEDQASGQTSVWVDVDVELTYTNTRVDPYWMDGNSWNQNIFLPVAILSLNDESGGEEDA